MNKEADTWMSLPEIQPQQSQDSDEISQPLMSSKKNLRYLGESWNHDQDAQYMLARFDLLGELDLEEIDKQLDIAEYVYKNNQYLCKSLKILRKSESDKALIACLQNIMSDLEVFLGDRLDGYVFDPLGLSEENYFD